MTKAADCSAAFVLRSDVVPGARRISGSAPAMPCVGTEGRVLARSWRELEVEGMRPELLHHDHRIPAPSVSAMQASSATAMLMRARIAYTESPFEGV